MVKETKCTVVTHRPLLPSLSEKKQKTVTSGGGGLGRGSVRPTGHGPRVHGLTEHGEGGSLEVCIVSAGAQAVDATLSAGPTCQARSQQAWGAPHGSPTRWTAGFFLGQVLHICWESI